MWEGVFWVGFSGEFGGPWKAIAAFGRRWRRAAAEEEGAEHRKFFEGPSIISLADVIWQSVG
jgi:hypothetical protein